MGVRPSSAHQGFTAAIAPCNNSITHGRARGTAVGASCHRRRGRGGDYGCRDTTPARKAKESRRASSARSGHETGDSYLIGGMIKPGTAYEDLPSNWRCPTCRASKDNFAEKVETIPGFEVNQGYGFGTNSMTTGEKNTLIWGSIAGFFLLSIGGYALS